MSQYTEELISTEGTEELVTLELPVKFLVTIEHIPELAESDDFEWYAVTSLAAAGGNTRQEAIVNLVKELQDSSLI